MTVVNVLVSKVSLTGFNSKGVIQLAAIKVRQTPRYTQVGNAAPLFAEQLSLANRAVLAND